MVSSLWKNSIKKKQNKNFQQPPAWFDAVKICEMVLHPIELCAQLIYVSGWTMSLYRVYYKQAHISKDRENLVSNLVLWVSSIYPETSSTVQVRLYHTLCHSDIDWPVNLPRSRRAEQSEGRRASGWRQVGYRLARQGRLISARYHGSAIFIDIPDPMNFPDIFKISILVATCLRKGCGIESILILMVRSAV